MYSQNIFLRRLLQTFPILNGKLGDIHYRSLGEARKRRNSQ